MDPKKIYLIVKLPEFTLKCPKIQITKFQTNLYESTFSGPHYHKIFSNHNKFFIIIIIIKTHEFYLKIFGYPLLKSVYFGFNTLIYTKVLIKTEIRLENKLATKIHVITIISYIFYFLKIRS